MNRKHATGFEVKPSPMSKTKRHYSAANGTRISNQAQREIKGLTTTGANVDVTFQVAEVNTPLGSVRRLCEVGNLVVFEGKEGECFIENLKTGFKIAIVMRNGMCWIDTWIKKDGSRPIAKGDEISAVLKALRNESESDFQRPV